MLNDKPLEYSLRTGNITIKKGEHFLVDHWKLYRIVRDSIELNKLMALDNPPNKLRDTRLKAGDQKLVVLQTNIDFRKLFDTLNVPE